MRKSVVFRTTLALLTILALVATVAISQGRPKSPRKEAATQIGDAWITVDYSGPILRGRSGIFGSGDEYGKAVYAGGPVWRAGADASTEISTDVDLMIGGKKVPAGKYRFLIELKGPDSWEAILTSKPAMATFKGRDAIGPEMWGSYGYSPDMDVARAPMTVQPGAQSIDQLTYFFADVSDEGGQLGIAWDTTIATLPFKVAK